MIKALKMISLCISFGICIVFSGAIAYGGWESIHLPYVSSGWDLRGGCHFTSSNEGWAVGLNGELNIGVLLHYLNGEWLVPVPPVPPDIGNDHWILNGVQFTSSNEGWAVGSSWDISNEGVILDMILGFCFLKYA